MATATESTASSWVCETEACKGAERKPQSGREVKAVRENFFVEQMGGVRAPRAKLCLGPAGGLSDQSPSDGSLGVSTDRSRGEFGPLSSEEYDLRPYPDASTPATSLCNGKQEKGGQPP